MNQPHLLDRRLEGGWPTLATDADVRAFESMPYAERIAASSTYEALQFGAAQIPKLRRCFPAQRRCRGGAAAGDAPRIPGAGHAGRQRPRSLGVGPHDVVSLLLPLIPQAFFTLFGAEAAGIANPVNPLL